MSLEKNEKSLEFWRALIVIADDALDKLQASETQRAATGVAEDVKRDVDRVLSGKTPEQLSMLKRQIVAKLQSNEPVDVEYWENLLRELVVYKAKAKLSAMHQHLLARRLEQLRTRQQEEALKVQKELEEVLFQQEDVEVHGEGVGPGEGLPNEPVDEALMEEQDRGFEEKPKVEDGYTRAMSPEPIAQLSRDDRERSVLDPVEDMRQLVSQQWEIYVTDISNR